MPPLSTSRLPKTSPAGNAVRLSITGDAADLALEWTASQDTAAFKHAISAAELFWVATDGSLTSIEHIYGAFKEEWPTLRCSSLSLDVPVTSFLDTAKADPVFGFRRHTHYFARLFFIEHGKPPPPPKASHALLPDVPDTPAALHAQRLGSLFPMTPVLQFPGHSSLQLWTTRSLLETSTHYFDDLFRAGLNESTARTSSEHEEYKTSELPKKRVRVESSEDEDDSDDETDEFAASGHLPTVPAPLSDLKYHEILFIDASYTSYRALLCFLQTGYFSFAKLSFTIPPRRPDSPTPSSNFDALTIWVTNNPTLPLPSSPKSAYTLAHFLDLPDLQSLALLDLQNQLTVSNIAQELFTPFANRYEGPRVMMVKYAVQNWPKVKDTNGFKTVLDKFRRNELASGPVSAELLPYILCDG
ncbi:hypothetical protein JCM11641_006391 [Rhodosporidiobolus odoratus]